jgi:hypothetical protein
MTKTKNYTLSMSKDGGAQTDIAASPLEAELIETIRRIAMALTVAEYRGNVQFYITYENMTKRASNVTFSADAPTGIWTNS